MRVTYIYHKDSTLWAFEGPEEPKYCADFGDIVLICGNTFCRCDSHLKGHIAAMTTARESALPVVNADQLGFDKHPSGYANIYLGGQYGKHPIQIKNEPVAMPGWGLEKVACYDSPGTHGCPNNCNGVHCKYPKYYRLKRSEPEKHVPVNDDICNACWGSGWETQFVTPCRECNGTGKVAPERKDGNLMGTQPFVNNITLTFYSGKLWHSDKPFPKTSPDQKSWYHSAYEVVNPEVIPGMDDYFSGYTKPVDGDQITLPAGYGTKWDTVNPCREVRKCLNERPDGDTCNQFNGAVCQRIHTVAVITLPEKPDNRAHGDTEGYVESPRERIERAMIAMKLDEPSESQEETDEMWMEVCVDAYAVEIIGVSKVIKKLKEKFTITRK